MTNEAEVEAWIRRKRKRILHNQLLIQASAVLSIALPIPIATLILWAMFGLGSSIIIQGLTAVWIMSTIVYVALSIYIKAKQGKP